jgi:hypothetical protein
MKILIDLEVIEQARRALSELVATGDPNVYATALAGLDGALAQDHQPPENTVMRNGVRVLSELLRDEMGERKRQAAELDMAADEIERLRTALEMSEVGGRFVHRLALELECVLLDYSGKWWDSAAKVLDEYRAAMNAIYERECPTHMGEPVVK